MNRQTADAPLPEHTEPIDQRWWASWDDGLDGEDVACEDSGDDRFQDDAIQCRSEDLTRRCDACFRARNVTTGAN